jgi:hypothetical protein
MRFRLDVPFFAYGAEKGMTVTALRTDRLPASVQFAAWFDLKDSFP